VLTLQLSTQHKNEKNKVENEATKNKLKMKLKLKQNIGMSVHIAVVNTTQKGNEIELLNRILVMENNGK